MKAILNLKLKYQISILVAIATIFQIIICVVSFNSLSVVNSNLEKVFQNRLPSIDNIVQADRDFQQALVAERTLLIDGIDQKEIKAQIGDYTKNRDQVIGRFKKYAELSESEVEKKLIKEFYENYDDWKKYSEKNLPFLKEGYSGKRNAYTEKSLKEASKRFEKSRGNMDALQEEILNYAKAEFQEAERYYSTAKKRIFILFGACLLTTVVISIIVIRGVNKSIGNALSTITTESDNITNISVQLTDKSTNLSSASTEQASNVSETSSSLHEISEMVKKNTDIAVDSANIVNKGQQGLNQGLSLINTLNDKVKEVNSASIALAGKVDANHSRFEEILSVFENIQSKTSVINDIVFQTKLLSFNASVEAARAGEDGKGFSVVAEEVGNLATASGKSASEISELLDGSLENISNIINNSKEEVTGAIKSNEVIIEEALRLSAECESVLKQMEQLFKSITESTNEIASSSKEQSAGVDEINNAVHEISSASQLTSQNANDVEISATQLNELSKRLVGSLEDLKKII